MFERHYETQYDNLSTGTTGGASAKTVYYYTSKRRVRKQVQKVCPCCNGTGNRPVSPHMVLKKKQEPTVRYITTTEMYNMSLNKFKQGYNIKKRLGGGYYIAQFKHNDRYHVLAKVQSTELGYEIIHKYIRPYAYKVHDTGGNFQYYKFRDYEEDFYYDRNFNFQFQTKGFSEYLGFDGLYWVKTKNGATLKRFPNGYPIVAGDYQIRAIENPGEKQLWEKYGMLIAKQDGKIGIINKTDNGKVIVPFLFSDYDFSIDHETQLFKLVDGNSSIFHYFTFDGKEILAKPTLHKTCPNGDEIYEFTRDIRVPDGNGGYSSQVRKVYELKATNSKQGLAPYYSYCGCYDKNGVAKVLKFNSTDTLYADVYGKIIDQSKLDILQEGLRESTMSDDEVELLAAFEQNKGSSYISFIETKEINGKRMFASKSYKDGAFVFDEMVLLYPGSLRAFALRENGKYAIFQVERDYGYNILKPSYKAVDPGAVNDDAVPVQAKNGKWGLFQLSGRKSQCKEIVSCTYDRFESFSYNRENENVLAVFQGDKVVWLKTNTLNKPGGNRYVSHRFIEAKTEFEAHIRWLKKSRELRASTVLSIFDQTNIEQDKALLAYHRNGPLHLFDLGEEQQTLWHEDYPTETFRIPSGITGLVFQGEKERVTGIQKYLDVYVEMSYKNGTKKMVRATFVKKGGKYEAFEFKEVK
ncbi:MAG: hypothetical protein AB8F95_18225 [Bacteroidia bacterium]